MAAAREGRDVSDRRRYREALDRQRADRLMASRDPNPERITTALNAAGLYGPEVDRACGVEEPTVDLWESGELVPTREQMEALAWLCGVTPTFFYRDVTPIAVWMCGSDGCQLVEPERRVVMEPEPVAEVLWLPGRGRLF